jgi:hypothetical protein
MVQHRIGDHTDAAVPCGADHLGEVAWGSEALVDPIEVADVVAVIELW